MNSATNYNDPLIANILGDLQHKWGWLLALGLLFLLLGTIGLGMTFILTMASMMFFGYLMLVGGIFQFIHSFKCKGWKSLFLHVLAALVYIIGGMIVITNPLLASSIITMIIAIVLMIVGAMRIIMALQIRTLRGWWLPLLSGVVSLIFGSMILAQWPISGMWIIGLLIAVDLIIHGWGYVVLALAARNITDVSNT